MIHTGRHFLQIPGPTNVPDRILRAMDHPVIDHRGPEFAKLALEVLEGVRETFQRRGGGVGYRSADTGGGEGALGNTCSPSERALIFETGNFSQLLQPGSEKIG